MKKMLPFLLMLFLIAEYHPTQAQNFEDPVVYLEFIGKQQTNISKKFLSYASASAHGKKAKKVDVLRTELLDEVQNARMNIAEMPPFNGDKKYRDTAVSFMKLYYNVLNEDYGKIVNMEEVAEQSYDLMEAYMLAKELAEKKLDVANDRFMDGQKKFASNNNIKLLEGSSELETMMEDLGALNVYYNELYLIFFRPFKQEVYLMEAIEKSNITSIEQNKNSLKKYAEEGLAKLATIRAFKGDVSVLNSCKKLLEFYVKEADKTSAASEYFLTKERFETIKKDFEKKTDRTKADVDNFNKLVNETNIASQAYNKNVNEMNASRKTALDNWNQATEQFFDTHTPHYD